MAEPIEYVGLVLAIGDALLKLYTALEEHYQAKRDLPKLLMESRMRVYRMCGSINRFSLGVNYQSIPGAVLKRAGDEFEGIRLELETLINLRVRFKLRKHVEKIRETNDKLRALEHHLDICGLMSHESMSLREQLVHVTDAVRKIAASQDNMEISRAVKIIDSAMKDSEKKGDDVDVVPEQAKNLLNALSKSGLKKGTKLELATMARKVWEGWKVNLVDIEFVRKHNGDRTRIGKGGAAEVYLGRMKLRDDNDDYIPGDPIDVAVKQFTVKSCEAKDQFALFIREVFLQMEARHPCIVRTLGGYFPTGKEAEGQKEIEPCIVMERMTHTLREVQENKLLKSVSSKRRILSDIAAGLAHLHSRRIVHRDIKPENVLMRVVDGKIVGRAKVSDFSVSRKAQQTNMATTTMQTSTGLAGTLAYMPPEAFSESAQKTSMTSRDIWSFGVLMCEVLVPNFLGNLVKQHPEGLHVMAIGGAFARKISASAKEILYGKVLGDLVISCLAVDAKSRPRIEDVADILVNDVPLYQFHFINYLSWNSRAAEVLRYVRHCFVVDAQTCTVVQATKVLENAVENGDVSAQNVLAYCYYFGVGVKKDKNKAMALYKHGSDSGDATAMSSLGAVHFSARAFDGAVPLLKMAADQGSAAGLIYLATCHRYGYGVQKNEKKAFQLTSSAAEAGNQDAQAWLASYFRSGTGTAKDERKAIAMLYGLSARGNPFASMWLALYYKQGLGVPHDEAKAKEFLGIARERGIVGSWVFNKERNWWVISGL